MSASKELLENMFTPTAIHSSKGVYGNYHHVHSPLGYIYICNIINIYNMISVSNSNYNVLAVSYASAQAYLRGNNLTYHTPTRHELMGNFNSKVFIFQKKN